MLLYIETSNLNVLKNVTRGREGSKNGLKAWHTLWTSFNSAPKSKHAIESWHAIVSSTRIDVKYQLLKFMFLSAYCNGVRCQSLSRWLSVISITVLLHYAATRAISRKNNCNYYLCLDRRKPVMHWPLRLRIMRVVIIIEVLQCYIFLLCDKKM